ncbi:MAG: hypothetical protein C0592_03170 [Marinilabiliales bacterium]|nr:MAG: hypothetical protein C0592_03170 [Marinilabiliales bacterium]
MKVFLLSILLSVSLCVFSQKDSTSKIKYSICLIPEFNILSTGNPVGHEETTSKIGFSAGFGAEFFLSNNLSLATGLNYGLKRYSHTHTGLIFGSDIDPYLGYISESSMESIVAYSELAIPINLKIYIQKLRLIMRSGIDIIYPIADHSERIIYYGNGMTDILGVPEKVLNFAPTFSLGHYFPLSGGDYLTGKYISYEFIAKYHLKSFVLAESNLFNLGLRISFYW